MKTWKAKWIENDQCPRYGSVLFMREFELESPAENGEIHISGLGNYRLWINGKAAFEDLLQPAFSAYDKRVYYNTYAVAHLLRQGNNTIRAELGNGWFNEPGDDCFDFEHAAWKSRPTLIAELWVNGALVLVTDSTWKTGAGKTTYNSVRFGEDYDARLTESFDNNAVVAKSPGGILHPQNIPPIRIQKLLSPVRERNGVYDFGINLSGDIQVSWTAPAGTTATILYGERLDSQDNIDQTLIKRHDTIPRTHTEYYTFSQDSPQIWHQSFGYRGFRYVQIKGDVQVQSLKARLYHSDIQSKGSFRCAHEGINNIMAALRHSTLTNCHHILTDCPHREKNGWTGDAHASCEQALYNFDMIAFYRKYLDDLVDCQRPNGQLPCIAPTSVYGFNFQSGPTWDAALVIIPWQLYRFTGDTDYLLRYYAPMTRLLQYTDTLCENGICRSGLGDFLPDPATPVCPDGMMLTCFVLYMQRIMGKIATLLGNATDGEKYQAAASDTRAAIIATYKDDFHKTISAMATALYFDLCAEPKQTAEMLVQAVRANAHKSGGGLFSSTYVMEVLTQYGYFEDALLVATQDQFPGWLHMLGDGGGTLWEHWSGKTGSLNHHMRSAIGAWFYKALAGIAIDDSNPGFRHVRIQPHFSPLIPWLEAEHESPLGIIGVKYDPTSIEIMLPEGVDATLILDEKKYFLSGNGQTIRMNR